MIRVKICGLTSLEDALAAVEAGADLLGFVLVASSPRHVEPRRAGAMVRALRARGVRHPCVGVVAGLPLAEVRRLKAQCGFDLVQLHGGEGPALATALYPCAIVARQVTDLRALSTLAACRAYAYLLDARGAEGRGGAPVTWDWHLARRIRVPGRIIVAGGLTPDNVAEAVRAARPWGVDVASGVEAAPGRKDRLALARFVKAVREVEDAYEQDC